MNNTTFVLLHVAIYGPLFTFLLTSQYHWRKHSREMSVLHEKERDAETKRKDSQRVEAEQRRHRDREQQLEQQAHALRSTYERRLQELEQWKLTVDERLPPLSE